MAIEPMKNRVNIKPLVKRFYVMSVYIKPSKGHVLTHYIMDYYALSIYTFLTP